MATILCIEDEDHIREDVAELLESGGHKTLQACDGKAGLEMILEHSPNLVVSDITMPVMNGRELLVALRGNYPKFASMPFIFLSALADRDDVMDGMKLGADDYLTKPIDLEMLANKVEVSLRQVERMTAQKEEQFVKLFNALSQDAAVEPAAAPIAQGEPERVDSAAAKKSEEQTTPANDKKRKKIFGTVFRFGKISAIEHQTESHRKGIVDWLEETACKFLNRVLPAKASVSLIPNGGVLVCYRDGDKDTANEQSKQLAKKLEDHLQKDQLDELARKTSVSREMLSHLVLVTECLYEAEIGLEDLDDPDRLSAAVKAQIDDICTDTSAPTRLSASIRDDGHLVPLTLFKQDGGALPIKFFNYDDESRQKLRSSFALFGADNLAKAGFLIDLMTLDLLEEEVKKIDRSDGIVVDANFDTLISEQYYRLYLSKFMKFANKSRHKIMINVRTIPADTTSMHLDEILRPLGKHAARRIVQITPGMIEAHASSRLPVSSMVFSYSEMVRSKPDCSLFTKEKQQLSKAGTLLILRGLPSQNDIVKFTKYNFDGYAVAPR